MMTFTVEELKAWIEGPYYEDYGSDWDAYDKDREAWSELHEEGDSFWYEPEMTYEDQEVKDDFVSKFGQLPATVASWNLGDGKERGVVFSIGDRLFKKTGWYSSWDTGEWDGPLEEVEPYEVVKIRYRPIGEKK